ncbi:MAG: PKD domain-containing protein [Thermogutta sp.]|uniref:PKD domain-containing protein n=1 Tax=Thermogutta sp. TaxID=1962930 RepID=UPI00198913AE|nr:PKD domain-containing protein [Thermogutta sp.]MBC7353590.1 PKD domain-containing protein [Thermogutta sp.]
MERSREQFTHRLTAMTGRYVFCSRVSCLVCLVICLMPHGAQAQLFRRAGHEFSFIRPIDLAATGGATIGVVEFYHHGQIDQQGQNVIVAVGNEVLPVRILQIGPGDFCRLAFQITAARATSGRGSFEILYGGDPFPEESRPKWSAEEGLLLEVREYKECNLNSLQSVKAAFESARPIGADYVPTVFHAGNPFASVPGPYMSRYSGVMQIPRTGTYGFYTSSQDCSFLLIDGKIVAEAPGRHPPERRARPGLRRDVQLTAGPHRFEYYHVSTSEMGVAVAAWEVEPRGSHPAPVPIPPEVFRNASIVRPAVGPPMSQTQRFLPDFRFNVVGAVSLPENEIPLVVAEFRDASPPALVSSARVEWDFGDGQTAQGPAVVHVFLRPGLFTIKETVTRAGRPFEMPQRIWIGPPPAPPREAGKNKPLQLDDILPVLDTYNPAATDAQSLLQMVQAYLTKADEYLPPPPPDTVFVDEEQAAAAAQKSTIDPKTRESERRKYLMRALEVARDGLLKGKQTGDEELLQLLRLVTPIAQDVFVDSTLAVNLWTGVLPRLQADTARAEAHLAVADIQLNDLLALAEAKKHLDAAEKLLRDPSRHEHLGALWYRLRGEVAATEGRQDEAVKALQQAEQLVAARRNEVERTAWRGAHSRSTEQFLRSGELDRAAAELRAWSNEFPLDIVEGYLPLLWGKYWFARGRYEVVTALADRLLVVNPYSPYIEELLLLSAQADLAMKRVDRAKATLESLLKDYPGSPLVGEAKQLLEKLQSATPERK